MVFLWTRKAMEGRQQAGTRQQGPLPSNTTAPLQSTGPGSVAASYATTEQIREAATTAAAAPLATTDLDGLVGRFSNLFPVTQQEHRQFDAHGFAGTLMAHLEAHGLVPPGGTEHPQQGNTITVVNRPAFDHMHFFVDPTTIGTGQPVGYSVSTAGQRGELASRGYLELALTNLPNDARMMPTALPAPAAPEHAQGAPAEGAQAVPAAAPVSIPADLPSVSKSSKATVAAAICEWWEEAVDIDGVQYSPMHTWTVEERAANGFNQRKHSNEFTKRCKMYIWIKAQGPAMLVNAGNKPMTYSNLRDAVSQEVMAQLTRPAGLETANYFCWASYLAKLAITISSAP